MDGIGRVEAGPIGTVWSILIMVSPTAEIGGL
jgi:hypothetical protein